jgi:hypothetical protein
MRHVSPILLLVAVILAFPGAAVARQPPAEPWATVNVCDTAQRPDEMGIRGGMSGITRSTRMFMRFRVQYRDTNGRWRLVKTGADSEWQRVATGRRGSYDSGWTFRFKPPASGGAHVLRGVVTFQWRRGTRIVQRDKRFTEAGHPDTAGAEPADFSAESCEIA